MKKITALLLSIAIITSLSACGEKKQETASTDETTTVTTTTTKVTTQTTTKNTITKIEENTSYELDTEYSFHNISFNICSEWDFKDGETPSWYANSTSFVMARYDIIEGATYFDIQEYVSGLEKNSDIKVNKSTPITLFDNTDAAIIEMKYIANDVNIVEYCFMIEDELYCIGASGNISNYVEKIIDTIQIKQKETEPTKEKVPVYQNNMYKVGTDIDAGEYMLFAEDDIGGYVCVSSDANQDDIVYNENFENNLIATFEDGEYVDLSRCFAIPYDKVTADISKLIKSYIDDGAMYKVGTNLEAGEYKLEATGDYGGYYCIYSDSRHDDIITNDNFDNNTYVSVSDGEYLLLSHCKIIE